ncbi:MAG TPA: putative N-acetylmannosamine-6-phosphate 2-epimerase [bacterium]
MDKQKILAKLKGGLIVSCQAEGEEPLNSPQILAALAKAAIEGGARGIRAERPENLVEIKKSIELPIIGLYKKKYHGSEVYITPTLTEALEVIATGIDILALDATNRPRPNQEILADIIRAVRKKKDVLLMADIATLEQGLHAAELGFDFMGTTLSGYTENTSRKAVGNTPDFELLSALVAHVGNKIPIIAEGRFWTADDCVEALRRGAFAVVVGTAITRPTVMTRKIVDQIERFHRVQNSVAIGVDLGGTKTAIGLVSYPGAVKSKKIITSKWNEGTGSVVSDIISEINKIIESFDRPINAIGIAASGRVDQEKGIIFDGVPLANDYIGYPLKDEISNALHLPVMIENDANAAAYAEYSCRKDDPPQRLVFLTIGTGIGGGIVIDGKLLRGQGNAGEIGHICIEQNGRKCRCGRTGCLEAYVSRKLLEQEILEYLPRLGLSSRSLTTDTMIEFIKSNHPEVMKIFHRQMDYLASGLETVFNIVDPDLLVLGGELARLGAILVENLQNRLLRPIHIRTSKLGNDAGMIGAALLAMKEMK